MSINRGWGSKPTLISTLEHLGPAQRAVALVLVLHLDHAPDAEHVVAVEPDGQPANRHAWASVSLVTPQKGGTIGVADMHVHECHA